MNTEETVPTAAPTAEPATPAPTPLPDLSIEDHEADYPALTRAERAAERRESRASAPAGPELGTDGAPLSDGQAPASDARDDKGRFRHRAKSQRASAADVPRINELTAKLRATEAERDALKANGQPSRVAAPVQTPAPPVPQVASTVSATAPQFKEFLDALKPNETYDDAVQRHAEAMADWRYQKADADRSQKAANDQFYGDFKTKIADAAKAYPDFQAVAMDADSKIPAGSLIDSWVWEHPAGGHVLYHMQKNPADLARIHALPRLEQLSELSLLSQRLTSPSRTVAAGTGSAPAPVVVNPAPKPPNPVRTGPTKAPDAPLGDNASLADHEARYGQPRRRR